MSPSHNILDLGLSDFNETWELQKKLQAKRILNEIEDHLILCLLYTSPSPRDAHESRMPSSA